MGAGFYRNGKIILNMGMFLSKMHGHPLFIDFPSPLSQFAKELGYEGGKAKALPR